ncbi:uncharacterized protein PgNI_04281 [Pyricularia grisea]|uniref:Repressor of RNA polymerase III transcription MAF1 n=1 Tax=Pyricularia grisea TaxID=148305 RepID=A0A6P8BDU3_PYRGI|nr:uncharacterized protein PgNI_04281 [Pyricularia grisea]TLD14046.1 hypothetical protein PgNI_04281 [Pyricularia grisea]
MQFIPVPDFVTVTSALNFDTPDCHVSGGCDLYTTKPTGQDKKLYKRIDGSLESQHESLLKFGASLSPPQRAEMASTLNLSRSSPFGSLADISSRRTFAYIIATLNASHPDYDFSHVLRPSDFKREKNLRRVMNNLDSTLGNVRPANPGMDYSLSKSLTCGSDSTNTDPVWGPQMWATIDKEMALDDCNVFSYQPAENPFDEEEGAIWALHYFFFNKQLKRVAYLHVRGVPVTSSHSEPPYRPPHRTHAGAVGSLAVGRDEDDWENGGLSSSLKGANKRARFWFGDSIAERIRSDSDDDMDDGMVWNRTADGEFDEYRGDFDDNESMGDGYSEADEMDTDFDDDESERGRKMPTSDANGIKKGTVRAVSEDVAAQMEIE